MGRRKQDRLPKDVYNYIEYMLSEYLFMRERLDSEYKLLQSMQENREETAYLSALSPIALCNLEHAVKAVEGTIKRLKPMEAYVFQRFYIDGCKDRLQIAAEIPTSPETYGRIKRRIIKDAGRRLGVLWDE